MNKLLNCPFCGGETEFRWKLYRKIKSRGQSYLATIKCKKCTAQVSQAAFDVETAKKYTAQIWNKRDDAEIKRLTAELEQVTRQKNVLVNFINNPSFEDDED